MTRLGDNIGSIMMEVEILAYTYIRNIVKKYNAY